MSFHIETIPNRRGRDTVLLREAWREGAKVRKRTIANLTYLPPAVTDGFRAVLRCKIRRHLTRIPITLDQDSGDT